jgi:hypothetical protein
MRPRPSSDPLLGRMPRPGYNCLDFAMEAWAHLYGNCDVVSRLNALSEGVHSDDGRVILSAVRGFRKLSQPTSPCFVVMQRSRMQPHIGIFYSGRVLHMKENGVEFEPLPVAKRYFTRIGFYADEQ